MFLVHIDPTFLTPRQSPGTWFAAFVLSVCSQVAGFTAGLWNFKGKWNRWLPWPTMLASTLLGTLVAVPYFQLKYPTVLQVEVAFGTASAFAGFLYSQTMALSPISVPYFRQNCAIGFSLGAFWAAITLIFMVKFQRYESLPDIFVMSISVCAAAILGFILGANRPDDYIMPVLRALFRRQRVSYCDLPRVTPLRYVGLEAAIKDAAAKDWDNTLACCELIWRYTQQRRAVIRALYDVLVTSSAKERETRWHQIVAKDTPWKLGQSFVHRGERTAAELWRDFTSSTSVPLIPDLSKPISDNRVKQTLDIDIASSGLLRGGKIEGIEKAEHLYENIPELRSPEHVFTRLSLMKSLKLLRSLSRPIGFDSATAYQLGLPDQVSDMSSEAASLVRNLREIYHYCWLAYRCQTPEIRKKAADVAMKLLLKTDGSIKDVSLVDCGVADSVHALLKEWKTDIEDLQTNERRLLKFRSRSCINPFVYDEPVRNHARLVNRGEAIGQLFDAWLDSHYQVTEIVGPILSGKTSLFLSSLENSEAATQSGSKILYAHVCIRHLNTDIDATARVANAIYDELREHVQILPPLQDLRQEPYRTLEHMIRDICERNKYRLLIGIDDSDHLERIIEKDTDFARFLRFIFHLNEFISHLGIVLIGVADERPQHDRWLARTTRYAKVIRVGSIADVQRARSNIAIATDSSNREIAKFLNDPGPGFLLRFQAEAVNRIIQLSGGQPYLIQLIAWNMVECFRNKSQCDQHQSSTNGTAFTDPFFSRVDVDAAISAPDLQKGCQYYVNRLFETFGDDWGDAIYTLRWAMDRNGTFTRPELEDECAKNRTTMDIDRIDRILQRLINQELIYEVRPEHPETNQSTVSRDQPADADETAKTNGDRESAIYMVQIVLLRDMPEVRPEEWP